MTVLWLSARSSRPITTCMLVRKVAFIHISLAYTADLRQSEYKLHELGRGGGEGEKGWGGGRGRERECAHFMIFDKTENEMFRLPRATNPYIRIRTKPYYNTPYLC